MGRGREPENLWAENQCRQPSTAAAAAKHGGSGKTQE